MSPFGPEEAFIVNPDWLKSNWIKKIKLTVKSTLFILLLKKWGVSFIIFVWLNNNDK